MTVVPLSAAAILLFTIVLLFADLFLSQLHAALARICQGTPASLRLLLDLLGGGCRRGLLIIEMRGLLGH